MSSHAQLAIQQFAKNVTHGIFNVKIVEQKMELVLLQFQIVMFSILVVKLEIGGRNMEFM